MARVTRPPESWTGAGAARLQAALRLSNEDFAEQLGVAPRTVAMWHAQPGRQPRPEMQRALDTVLEKAPGPAQDRFGSTGTSAPAVTNGLHVAIAVVVHQQHVLLVQRRDGELLSWQFPAGIVKPEKSADRVAVQETKTETAVDVAVSREIGSRIHPITGVYCRYFFCEYLAGEAANEDKLENVSVAWAPINLLARFIPPVNIYPPVLDALGVAR